MNLALAIFFICKSGYLHDIELKNSVNSNELLTCFSENIEF